MLIGLLFRVAVIFLVGSTGELRYYCHRFRVKQEYTISNLQITLKKKARCFYIFILGGEIV